MMTDANVQVCQADGSECFVCDKKISVAGNIAMIQITFKVMVTIKKALHIECASTLKDLLDIRIMQAKRR